MNSLVSDDVLQSSKNGAVGNLLVLLNINRRRLFRILLLLKNGDEIDS